MGDSDRDRDRDWQFALEDLEVDEEEEKGLEPGSPSVEGVFFVVLGAAVTVASFAVAFLL